MYSVCFFFVSFACFLKTNKRLKCIVCKYGKKKRTERKRNIWIAIQETNRIRIRKNVLLLFLSFELVRTQQQPEKGTKRNL